ncbi:Conserved_hypothetical protein [Hexamita inflata]|uniref:Uncharacterized protein n=1 Tax=Hexamita inflata TaxID=28002 RepID=A0AA86U0T1_9EUKA|nr:Conserved hypothetical protein [Hexamita inflata]CAI9974294.1 Conserved hypothetical protein [Hexamita inflata]
MSVELQEFENALKQDFLLKYSQKVTQLAFKLFTKDQPLKQKLTQTQTKQIEQFSNKFAQVYDLTCQSVFTPNQILMNMNGK